MDRSPASDSSRPSHYADRVAEREACLVDVYGTLLRCDFAAHRAELPTLAGLTPELWGAGYSQVGKAFGLGQLSKAEGFERILRAGGAEQPSYCAGAEALGITAVQIAGAELDGRVPADGATVVRSLSDVAALF